MHVPDYLTVLQVASAVAVATLIVVACPLAGPSVGAVRPYVQTRVLMLCAQMVGSSVVCGVSIVAACKLREQAARLRLLQKEVEKLLQTLEVGQ